MRKLMSLSVLFALLASQIMSCSVSQKLNKEQNELILGKWVVESVDVGGETVAARELGGEILFEFNHDGTAFFTTPDGQTERGKFAIQSGKIFDPESPLDDPVDIVHLSRSQLVISMVEEGEMMKMTLRPGKLE